MCRMISGGDAEGDVGVMQQLFWSGNGSQRSEFWTRGMTIGCVVYVIWLWWDDATIILDIWGMTA